MRRNNAPIEFVGGPYDGILIGSSATQADLLSIVEMPVNRDVLLALAGQPTLGLFRVATTAIYALDTTAARLYYRFLRQRQPAPENVETLQRWCREVVRQASLGRFLEPKRSRPS